MPRYKLRTLLILLAVLPPLLAVAWSIAKAKIAEWQRPAVSWNEAIQKAQAVQPRGGGLVAEDHG
jgi:hypothetical protein